MKIKKELYKAQKYDIVSFDIFDTLIERNVEKPTDIFSLCGFGQYSNFYRAFKKYYHMSPMTFLKKMNYEEKNE